MLEKTLKALEFDKILEAVAFHASSVPAREEIYKTTPFQNAEYVSELLEEVSEADKIAFEYATNLSFAFDDVSAILDKAEVMSVLSMGELLRVARMLRVAYSVKNAIGKVPDDSLVRLKRIAASIYTDKPLEESIEAAIVSETEMHDRASEELRSIRIRIKKTGEQIKTKLYSFITSPAYAKYLQDNIVTIRGDRYVIPVKAEWKSAIPGLIHDQSASGQTLYIEPMSVVELNNTLKTHLIEEQQEIERILRAFTLKVSVGAQSIRDSFCKIIKLDTVFAKAYYANAIKAVKPVINTDGVIDIRKGRHPLIPAEKVVPTDIRLGKDFDLLFITGPNTGGKTVALKLVGLLTVMAMSGMFVPALEAELSIFSEVYTDIGDEQSIEQNLSTFSSHIANIVQITDNLDDKSLVLLDELGAGTDPTEGAALAISISQFIKEKGAKAVITTHYNELKEYAVVTDRAENASMDFNPLTYSPTYKLIVGTPGVSNALLIAAKLGLNPQITERARGKISQGKLDFENVVSSMEESRHKAMEYEERAQKMFKEADEIKKQAEKERDRLYLQREKMNENVRKETKRLVEEAMSEANDIISTLRSVLDEPTEANLFKARKLRKSLEKYVVMEDNEFEGFGEEAEGDISEGDAVLVKPLKAEGVVKSVDFKKNSALVMLGTMKSNFKLDQLQKLKKASKRPEIKPAPVKRVLNNEAFSPELNLIGLTSAEALTELKAYIDKAVTKGVNEVRIIHGYGTGKLRETVRNYLKECSAIVSYRDGVYGEGERGVTIARLK